MIEIIKSIKSQIKSRPNVGIILGSGLSQLCTQLENKIVIKYTDIPSFMNTTVDGHKGEFIIGNLSGSNQTLMFANGRFHYYEGIDYEKTHIIIDIFHKIGCKYIITTNSSGCLQPSWSPGDLMIINSHIDATFRTTPSTPVKLYGDDYYNPKLIDIALEVMDKLNIKPRLGTYGWTLGPTYETPAEVKMLKELGVSAVGMSTVPEVLVANHCGLPVIGISVITNLAAGMNKTKLSHQETLENASLAENNVLNLIKQFIQEVQLDDTSRDN